MEENRNDKKESYKELSALAFRLISVEKKSTMEVKNLLLQKELADSDVNDVIDKIEFQISSARKKAGKDRDLGSYLFFGGAIISGITCLFSDYMRFYVVPWGFMAYGAFLYIRGYSNRK